MRMTQESSGSGAAPIDPNQLNPEQVAQLGEVLDSLAVTIFGSELSERPGTRSDAMLFVNRMRQEIGLPNLENDGFPQVLAGAKEAVDIVGCA